VLLDRARYPYSLTSLGAALRRSAVIGPAHGSSSIVSVSSHATMQATCKHSPRDVSSRPRLAPTGRLRCCSVARRPRAAVPLAARRTAGDQSARARRRVTQGQLFCAHVGEVKSPRATEHSGVVASGWSHTALSTRKSDRDLASGLGEAGGADHSSDSHCFLLSLEEPASLSGSGSP